MSRKTLITSLWFVVPTLLWVGYSYSLHATAAEEASSIAAAPDKNSSGEDTKEQDLPGGSSTGGLLVLASLSHDGFGRVVRLSMAGQTTARPTERPTGGIPHVRPQVTRLERVVAQSRCVTPTPSVTALPVLRHAPPSHG